MLSLAASAAGLALLGSATPASAQLYNFNFSGTFDVLQHVSGVSPYYIPQWPQPRSPEAPQGCNITRVGAAIRHGQINMNSADYENYIGPFVEKVGNVTPSFDWGKVPHLEFLNNWNSPVDPSNDEMVTQSGLSQAELLGQYFRNQYNALSAPRIWASSAERTNRTARLFSRGYSGSESGSDDGTPEFIIVDEGEEQGANTLSPGDACPNYSGSDGVDELYEWLDIWTAPIIARLNSQISTVSNATLLNGTALEFGPSDINGMMLLCGYQSSINGSSPFCNQDLFRPEDWLNFEYGEDLLYHGNEGYGSQYSGANGYPWVKATSDLMTAENTTQEAFYSFVHRQMPGFLYVALGLFNNTAYSGGDINATMPSNELNPNRMWQSSKLLTYLTNVAIERLECNSYGYTAGDYYRVVTSGTPQVIKGCSDGPGMSCARQTWLGYVQQRANLFGSYSTACDTASEYSNSTDVLSIYTQ